MARSQMGAAAPAPKTTTPAPRRTPRKEYPMLVQEQHSRGFGNVVSPVELERRQQQLAQQQ